MKIRLVRHATMVVHFNGKRILVDPVLSPKGAMPPIVNSADQRRNPLVQIPESIGELHNADAVLLTHTHRDHFDDAAVSQLSKNTIVFCQPEDGEKLAKLGFTTVYSIEQSHSWDGITLFRTGGQHGTGTIGHAMGPVSGYVLKGEGEPSLYVAGDTIWCSEVEQALAEYNPDNIVLYGGEARFIEGHPITMTIDDIINVCVKAPSAQIAVVHMEAFNHCVLTRARLKEFLEQKDLQNRVQVPEDGELLF